MACVKAVKDHYYLHREPKKAERKLKVPKRSFFRQKHIFKRMCVFVTLNNKLIR